MSARIVVVSTAANCPDAARACCASVAREGVKHYFAAPDYPTFSAACDTLGAGGYGSYSSAGQIENLIALIAPLDPTTIVIHLDGDDELTPGAVERVAREYENPDVWLTYGSFVRSDGVRDRDWDPAFGTRYECCQPGRPSTPNVQRYIGGPREQRWRASHLRTFRAGLFHRISAPYYTDRITGQQFRTCVDRALMLPMIEMAGERYSVITEPLCWYNYAHDQTMTAKQRAEETRDRLQIHGMAPLGPLARRPW